MNAVRRPSTLIVALIACAFLPTAAAHAARQTRTQWPGGRWEPDAPKYGQQLVAGQPIPLRDGVTLAADVYYPTDESTGRRAPGRFPVILVQTPYLCDTPQSAVAGGYDPDYFVSRGYIFVIACLRGTGRSGGTFDMLDPKDGPDGAQVVEWAAHQLSGSNGEIGGQGCSYPGITQLMTAASLGPDSPLKAIIPAGVSADELYRELLFSWGMPTDFTTEASPIALSLIGPGAVAWGASATPNMLSGGSLAYDGDYWQHRTVSDYVERAAANDVPALMWFGWNDVVTGAGPVVYSEYQNVFVDRPASAPMLPGQRASGHAQMVIGPWTHCNGVSKELELEWYDTWLKHRDTGIADTRTPIHAWAGGADGWINAASYPMVSRYTRYYLGSNGALEPRRPRAASSAQLTYAQPDPSDPDTIVTYTSLPLRAGATVAGPVSASLYASTSGTNLSLIAALQDVAPDGTVTSLTRGNVVGSLRALDQRRSWHDRAGVDIRPYGVFASDSYLTPGRPAFLQFTLRPVVATVAPGHSLRVVLTTQTPASICSTYGENLLGFGNEDPCTPTAPQAQTLPGTYSVLAGPRTPSAINLPLLPYRHFRITGNGPVPLDWGTRR